MCILCLMCDIFFYLMCLWRDQLELNYIDELCCIVCICVCVCLLQRFNFKKFVLLKKKFPFKSNPALSAVRCPIIYQFWLNKFRNFLFNLWSSIKMSYFYIKSICIYLAQSSAASSFSTTFFFHYTIDTESHFPNNS